MWAVTPLVKAAPHHQHESIRGTAQSDKRSSTAYLSNRDAYASQPMQQLNHARFGAMQQLRPLKYDEA